MDITTGFEYLNESLSFSSIINNETVTECDMKVLTAVQLQDSPFTNLARYVAQNRKVE